MHLPAAPHSSRIALLLPLEGRRWILSTGGAHGDTPPNDPAGYLEFVRGLRTPTVYNAIRHANRIGGVERFAFPASVRRHVERLETFPRGLLPIADAICRFNPTYGQGMSVAAAEACVLDATLAARRDAPDPLDGLGRAFFAAVQPRVDAPWAAVTLDFVYPQTTGTRPPDFEQTLKFGAALTALAAEDPAVHKVMLEVQHLLTPRTAFRDPALVERVRAMMAPA
jgi:2-polyprenyl-6-methoxyphenol hydroxylase-like FAD-dependent oxidoreductase